jgi:hypothetical protein
MDPLSNLSKSARERRSTSAPASTYVLTTCYPAGAFRVDKYWRPVNPVDNAFGDRNLVCYFPHARMAWPAQINFNPVLDLEPVQTNPNEFVPVILEANEGGLGRLQ